MKRVFLHPGYILSIKDGDKHYINAVALSLLYEVDINRCIVVREEEISPRDRRYPIGMAYLEGDVHLYPKFDGKYEALTL